MQLGHKGWPMHVLIELEQKLRLRQRQLPTFISRSFIVASSCFPLFCSKFVVQMSCDICRHNIIAYGRTDETGWL